MANIRLIKGRIKSAKNIAQITKAMELVAASKMKKAQVAALMGKAYASKIAQMVMELSAKIDMTKHPLLRRAEGAQFRRLVIFVSTNKGLCGGLNTNLFRFALKEYNVSGDAYMTLGKKGAEFLSQMGREIVGDFSGQTPFSSIVPAIVEFATKAFIDGTYGSVEIVYNEFVSPLKQTPRKRIVLPLSVTSLSDSEEKEPAHKDFLIEPSTEEVLEKLLPHYVENQIRDAILQAEASEHSARMMAMRNATDNAKSFMHELTLIYNKARQEKITYEITDMVTARLALEP